MDQERISEATFGEADLMPAIRVAHSCATDAREAVRDFHAAVVGSDLELVLFFCSSKYPLDVVAEEMNRLFAGVPVVGCTTAGEIGPFGCREHTLTGASFSGVSFTAVSGLLDDLAHFEMDRGRAFAQDLLQRLEGRDSGVSANNSFGFLMIDGLSVREEPVTHALQYALGRIPLFGGSAGDDLRFSQTYVYHQGRFHVDSGLLVLVSTPLPFRIFKTQHFVSTGERLVITASDPRQRIVYEINGLPAAEEYARLAGIAARDLNPLHFAAAPLVVSIGGADYVRSIQKANADGSLTFFCAIEEGLVMRLARGIDLVQNLQQAFERVRAEVGTPQAVFGCDCILRDLEVSQTRSKARVEALFRQNNTIGFNSYGEQFQGVHVNQTFTGIAIGSAPECGHG